MNKIRLLTLLLSIFFISCSTTNTRDENKELNAKSTDGIKSNELGAQIDIWKAEQDSLRKVLLSKKTNKALKSTILEELYILDLVKVKNEKLNFILPFSIHGRDCGAPDCYKNTLVFSFNLSDTLNLPSIIQYTDQLSGTCIDKEETITGEFNLIEQSPDYITYYDPINKSSLSILKNDKRKDHLYYFIDINKDQAKASLIYDLIDNYDETDEKTLFPYRCLSLVKRDYSLYLE